MIFERLKVFILYHLSIEVATLKRPYSFSVSLKKKSSIATALLDFSDSLKGKIIPEVVVTGYFLLQ